jgi:hypothetical protein
MKMELSLLSFPNKQVSLVEDLYLTGYKTGKTILPKQTKRICIPGDEVLEYNLAV